MLMKSTRTASSSRSRNRAMRNKGSGEATEQAKHRYHQPVPCCSITTAKYSLINIRIVELNNDGGPGLLNRTA